jgi:orotate phosphoribosyltransferase
MTESSKVAATESFVARMIDHGVLRFGDFTLKSGRRSPYFFNLGAIDDGAGLAALGSAYAAALVASELAPDVLFGPAYKGIPIAVATAIALQREHGLNVGVAFNRKEAKQHGEGGTLIGRRFAGRVVIVDDVMTAGTAVTEAAQMVVSNGARLAGVLVALDREETVTPGETAVTRMTVSLAAPVLAIATLRDVIRFLDSRAEYAESLVRIRAYQQEYCVA